MKQLSSNTWAEEEIAAAIRVLCSGQYTIGEETKRFERAYAE